MVIGREVAGVLRIGEGFTGVAVAGSQFGDGDGGRWLESAIELNRDVDVQARWP